MIDITASEVFSSHSHIVQNSIFDTSSPPSSSAAQQLLSNSLPMFNSVVEDTSSTAQLTLQELNNTRSSLTVEKKKSNKANIWTKLAKQFPPNVEYSSNHIAVFITGPPGSGKTTQIDLLAKHCKKQNIELSVQIGKELKKEAVRQLSSKYDVKKFEKKHSGEEPKLDPLSQEFAQQKALRCCLILRKNLNSAEEKLAQSATSTNSSPTATTPSSTSSVSTTVSPPVFYLYSRGPHCKEQAQFLHQKLNIRPNIYIVLEMNNQNKLIERINNRRYDPVTKKTYSMEELELLITEDKIAPEILARLEERNGDNAVNYPKRMKKYLSRSSVVLDFYEHELGVAVKRINAERNKEEVFADIVAALNPILGRHSQKLM